MFDDNASVVVFADLYIRKKYVVVRDKNSVVIERIVESNNKTHVP
jgi:hypothetical protein